MIVTIDGASGVGKTTAARLLSSEIDFVHLVGGVFFRSLTYSCIVKEIFEAGDIIKEAKEILPVIKKKDNLSRIFLEDIDVTEALWGGQVNSTISTISNISEVRAIRKHWLRNYAQGKNIVADGRTLGTEVFPNAEKKFYLLCNLENRTKISSLTNNEKKDFLENSRIRDEKDRLSSFDKFKAADDACVIDVTYMSAIEVSDFMAKEVRSI